MSVWAQILWLVMGLGVVAYALTGGADLGAGVWSLLARGPRAAEQRRATVEAIAPIWEANHVWLIFVIVVMFSAFSRGFAVLSTALHIPIALSLVGIVFRGAAFSFHAYGIQTERTKRRWEQVFIASSIATPVFLGTVVAGVSTGDIRVADGEVTTGFVAGWTTPFAWIVGAFALALFALLSAVYLAAEQDGALREDFRRRAMVAEIAAGGLAALAFWRAGVDAPPLYENLARSSWTWPVQGATALSAVATLGLLHRGRTRWARLTAGGQVTLVVAGWGLAMDGHLVLPDVRIADAVVSPAVLPALTIALGCGAVVLGPALWYLFRVFKGRRTHG